MAGTTENLHERAAIPAGTGAFMWTRLGSFLSLLPLGVWTINHLWDNLTAFSGGGQWEKSVTHYASPYSHVLTLTIVLGPLLIHAIWGIQRLFSFRPNNGHYQYFGNLKYLVQRIAAVGVLFFIGAHLWLALIHPRLVEGHAETFQDISQHMRYHLPTLIVYLLGTLGVAYHLANGVSTFAWQWGIVSGRRSLQRFDIVAAVIFAIVLIAAWMVIYAMYQAGATFGPLTAE